MITQAELKSVVKYDPETGIFTRLVPNKQLKKNVGDPIGYICKTHGYVMISILNSDFKAHRLAFLYMTGKMPDKHTDHINGIKTDNRFCNLRECTSAENQQNRAVNKNNKLKLTGVTSCFGKYQARIQINKKSKSLGLFNTPEEAHAAYRKAKESIHLFNPILRSTIF